jgi:hypothetical protein
MHFEAPEKLAKSLKEFLGHYLMIVVSILTALAAEHVATVLYNKNRAEVFSGQVERELQNTRRTVDTAIQENRATLATWTDLLRRAKSLRNTCAPQDVPEYRDILERAVANYRDFSPVFLSSSWESAVSAGMVVYFKPTDVQRYSNAYSVQRFRAGAISQALQGSVENMSQLSSLPYDKGADCTELARVLNLRVRMLSVLVSNLQQLQGELAN